MKNYRFNNDTDGDDEEDWPTTNMETSGDPGDHSGGDVEPSDNELKMAFPKTNKTTTSIGKRHFKIYCHTKNTRKRLNEMRTTIPTTTITETPRQQTSTTKLKLLTPVLHRNPKLICYTPSNRKSNDVDNNDPNRGHLQKSLPVFMT